MLLNWYPRSSFNSDIAERISDVVADNRPLMQMVARYPVAVKHVAHTPEQLLLPLCSICRNGLRRYDNRRPNFHGYTSAGLNGGGGARNCSRGVVVS